jgi:hypothetical protein
MGRAFPTIASQSRVKLGLAIRAAAFAGLSLVLAASPALAQPQAKVPWASGEILEYAVRLAGMKSGGGAMQVSGPDTMRGRAAWHLHFNIKGSAPLGLYHVDDAYESWMDVETLNSLRFEQNLFEGGKRRVRNYDIFPDRAMFHQEGKEERKSVADPLDDASFFFFVRTIPLEVGKEYVFEKYYNPDANPVVIKVLRRDTITVPAGRFPAIVLQPTIKTGGLFSENGHAEIWLSDDEHRILLKMETHFSVISLDLQLTKAFFPPPAPGLKH